MGSQRQGEKWWHSRDLYWKVNDDEIWLLTVYRKSERETIASHILKQIAEEIKDV